MNNCSQPVHITRPLDDVVDCDVTLLTSSDVVSVTGNVVDAITSDITVRDDDVGDDVIKSCDDVAPVGVFITNDNNNN